MTNSPIIWQSEEVAAPAAEAMAMKTAVLEAFEEITEVVSDSENAAATVHVESATRLIRDVEKARTTLKAKPWQQCVAIDKAAREFLSDLEAERTRINKLCGNFIQDKLEVQREAERARQRELDRIEKENAAMLAKAETTEQVESILAETKAAQEAVPEVAPLEKAAGQTVKPTMCFEVTDIYKLFRARPDLCKIEPIKSAINEVLALGVKDIAGLRIWEEVKVGTRQSKGPKFLEVQSTTPAP